MTDNATSSIPTETIIGYALGAAGSARADETNQQYIDRVTLLSRDITLLMKPTSATYKAVARMQAAMPLAGVLLSFNKAPHNSARGEIGFLGMNNIKNLDDALDFIDSTPNWNARSGKTIKHADKLKDLGIELFVTCKPLWEPEGKAMKVQLQKMMADNFLHQIVLFKVKEDDKGNLTTAQSGYRTAEYIIDLGELPED